MLMMLGPPTRRTKRSAGRSHRRCWGWRLSVVPTGARAGINDGSMREAWGRLRVALGWVGGEKSNCGKNGLGCGQKGILT